MLSVGRRTAGVDHAKLRELLLVTSRTCDLPQVVNERIISITLTGYTHRPGSASFQTNSGPMFRIATRGNIQTKACHSRPSLNLAGKKSKDKGLGLPKHTPF